MEFKVDWMKPLGREAWTVAASGGGRGPVGWEGSQETVEVLAVSGALVSGGDMGVSLGKNSLTCS